MTFLLMFVATGVIFQVAICLDVKLEYPEARRDMTVYKYNEIEIQDPYRWMEDSNSLETKTFVNEQNAISEQYLEIDMSVSRLKIIRRLNEMSNYSTFNCPRRVGDYYFYLSVGQQNHNVLYSHKISEENPSLLIDPNTFSGNRVLKIIEVSRNAKTVAFGLSDYGSDYFTAYFRDVETGVDYLENILELRFTTFTWTHDEKGVFYVRYDFDGEQVKSSNIYYHLVGTHSEQDVLVLTSTTEGQILSVEVSYCGRWLIIMSKTNDLSEVYLTDLDAMPNRKISSNPKTITIISENDVNFQYVTNDGMIFTFCTNKEAPNYRVVQIDVTRPNPRNWEIVVRTRPNYFMESAIAIAGDRLIVTFTRNVRHYMQVYSYRPNKMSTGQLLHTIRIPAGTITEITADRRYTEFFYGFVSYITPSIIYRGEVVGLKINTEIFNRGQVPEIDLEQFTVTQVFYDSTYGTKIPMDIISRKNMVQNGKTPCILSAVGDFDEIKMPSFDVSILMFISNMNGVYAVVNIGGGGDYQSEWHDDIVGSNKQKFIDSFIAATEFIINCKYTNPNLLAFSGTSNGGLIVAACANQRPDLYRTIVAEDGLMDMLKFHKFTTDNWISEYDNNLFDFYCLRNYSPLHNIPTSSSVQYPSVLLLIGENAQKVPQFHSLKFIASLQLMSRRNINQKNPFLMKIRKHSDHYGNLTTTIEKVTDIYCFIARTMNLSWIEVGSTFGLSKGCSASVQESYARKRNNNYTEGSHSPKYQRII